MRIATYEGRLVVVTGGEGHEIAHDVEKNSAGRFGPEPQAIYEDWDAFTGWAAGARWEGGVPVRPDGLGSPAPAPRQVFGIGLNYRDHAAETGAAIPTEPVVFMKASNTMVGPADDVPVPRGSTKTDWEVELGVVLGAPARYLETPEQGLAAVAGYAVSNDVSEREFQIERGGQWDKGKSCEAFNPFGPWLVPADEVGDPQDLALRLWVNGSLRQDGTTADMVFGVGHLIWYLSQFMVLEAGDVVNTGTPAGVAMGQPEPKPYLRAGDVVELDIAGLGRQRQVMTQA
jgi:2-keto-4-pentenoate hydratase/2-oxohepta-3-ene-1,7-dioic acid hydratase in catechol pathway